MYPAVPLYRFIVMEADSEINAWTRICVSQADCILLIGAEDADPSVSSQHSACCRLLTQNRALPPL